MRFITARQHAKGPRRVQVESNHFVFVVVFINYYITFLLISLFFHFSFLWGQRSLTIGTEDLEDGYTKRE